MALTVKIGVAGSEVDLTQYLVAGSLRIEQRADAFVSTCSLQLIDETADLGLAFTVREKDSILIADGATKYFSGTVANIDQVVLAEGTEAIVSTVECQDYNLLVEEVVIDQVETYGATLDSAIIDDLFDKYLPEINSHGPGGAPAGYVQSLHVFDEIVLVDISLREALDRIAGEVESTALEGYWYIDFDKYLHYYNIEDNAPAWYLSDDPLGLPDATNLVENPSFEVNITDFWNAVNWTTAERSGAHAKFGTYSARLYDASSGADETLSSEYITVSLTTDYVLSAWIKKTICTGTGRMVIQWFNAGFGYIGQSFVVLDSGAHDWKRYELAAGSPGTAAYAKVFVFSTFGVTGGTEFECYIDGVQFELEDEATPYLDGSLGAGYAWTGTPHNSTSTRTGLTSYSYLSDVSRSRQGSAIANRILVVGAEMALFVQDYDSYEYYGKWFEMVVNDNTLFSVDEVLAHGYSLLAKYAYPDEVFTVRTRKEGLRAGMNVRFENALFETAVKTNLIENPSFEINVTDSWTFWQDGLGGSAAQSAVRAAVGTQSCLITASSVATARQQSDTMALADGETISVQARIYRPAATTCSISIWDDTNSATRATLAADITAGWQILTTSWTNNTGNPANVELHLINSAGNGTSQVWFDGCMAQIAKGAYSLNYIDGTFPFCSWNGAAHNSTSSRLPVFTVRELALTWPENTLTFELTLGGKVSATSLISSRTQAGNVNRGLGPVVPGQMPVSSRGWSHNLVFTATDFDTVSWGSGTIETADGTVYSIVAGNTGAMAATTYIYLDVDTSLTVLQAAGSPAVGRNMILICIAEDVADEDTNKAILQVFGGQGVGVMVGADNIIAEAITANEIAANTILAGNIAAGAIQTDELDALAVTAAKIAANTITADKLEMGLGDSIFNVADGILLLGPHCEINTTEWWSLRRQEATISGAFQQRAGYWPGTRALQINLAVTNLIENPSFEVNITDFWLASNWDTAERSATHARFGGSSCRLYDATIDGNEVIKTDAHEPVIADTAYTLSVWIKKTSCTGTGSIDISWFTAAPAYISSETLTLDAGVHDWKRYVLSGTSPATATQARLRPCFFTGITIGTEFEAYVDGVQFEKSAYATPYLDGTLGTGFAWTGDAHNSTSTRTKTEVNLDDLAWLVTNNDTLSFRIVAQMPYDADVAWPGGAGYNPLCDIRGADNANRIILYYDLPTDEFYAYINGAPRITNGGTQTFDAGAWVDLVLTLDFAADEYYLYVNGILDGSDTTALAAPTLTEWNIGSTYQGLLQSGLAIAEFAVFDRVLTVVEVAALYAMNKPLIDLGSFDGPGIYILDGRFRIASSLTGNRIEMTANGIQVYDSAGVEAVGLTQKGLRLRGTSTTTLHEIHFEDADEYVMGKFLSSWGGGTNKAATIVTAERPTGAPWPTGVRILLRADDIDIAGEYCDIWIYSEGGVSLGPIAGGAVKKRFEITGDISQVFSVDSDGSIQTRAASSSWWRFGTADSGVAGMTTPDYKLHFEVNGAWYTVLAEAGSI